MKAKKIRVSRTGTRRLFALLCIVAMFMSCKTSAGISVKQSQGDQSQETEIQLDGSVKELSLHFVNSPVINPLTALN